MARHLCTLILGVLAIVVGCSAFVDHMLEEDVENLEKQLLARNKRGLPGLTEINIPFIFKNMPRLDVVTVEHKPFMYVENKCRGDACKNYFRGFMVDLMYMVARRMRMLIRFYEVPDGRFGSYDNATGTWNGLMGEVVKREESLNASSEPISGSSEVGSFGADIAAAPITITSERERYVDFVKPFAHLGLTVLIKRPEYKTAWPYDFHILKPLAPSVWLSAVIAMIVVWLFLWLMNRYNPYEYGERWRRKLASDEEASLFNMSGSFWYMFTILQWQGYDRSPRSLASKTMSCFWMMFVTVFLVVYISAYVNNLFWASTVHGVDPTKPTVSSLADLVSHKDRFTYGTLDGGSTLRYIMEVATGEEFELMKQYLNDTKNKDKLVANFSAGVEKVRAERFGFICESMMARYIMNTRPCDLTTIADFGARSYGLAVPSNSPHLEKLHGIILEMMEEGDIDTLEKKWFEEKGECWNVTEAVARQSSASQLLVNEPKQVNAEMFWSGIVLIIVGTVLSCFVAAAEILWYKYRGRYSASNRQRTQQLTNDDDGHI